MGDLIGRIFRLNSDLDSLSDEKQKAIRGWCYYDWAKSAFETSVVVAVLPVYFVAMFKEAYGLDVDFFGLKITGDSLFAWATFFSALIVALMGPGSCVIADRSAIKMKLVRYLTYVGVISTILLGAAFLFPAHLKVIWLTVFFFLANFGLLSATIFYNALLPHLSDETSASLAASHRSGPVKMDDISNRAYGYGYLGGGLLLFLHIILLFATGNAEWAIGLALATAGLWWYGFALFTIWWVPEPELANPHEDFDLGSATNVATTELKKTFADRRRFNVLFLYIIAFFLFIDGINSVTSLAGAFGANVLGIDLLTNMAVILIVQFVAAPAAMLFTKIAEVYGTKKALTASLVGWCIVIFGAVGFAPLELEDHEDYCFQFDWNTESSSYDVSVHSSVWFGDGPDDTEFKNTFSDILPMKDDNVDSESTGTAIESEVSAFLVAVDDDSRFGASVSDGPLHSQTALGENHPTSLGDGTVDDFTILMRDNVWKPLGFSITIQWLFLGVLAGLLLGGSQGLSRSLFAQMVPQLRSGEFFGFFGFFGRVAMFLGPFVYAIVTGIFDSRTAVLSLGLLVVIGAILLQKVDVEEGIRVAKEEDERLSSESSVE